MASPSSKSSVDVTKQWGDIRPPTPGVGVGKRGRWGLKTVSHRQEISGGLVTTRPHPAEHGLPSHLGAASRQLWTARRTGGQVQVTLFLGLTLCPREVPRSWRRPRLLHVRLPAALQPHSQRTWIEQYTLRGASRPSRLGPLSRIPLPAPTPTYAPR